MATPYVFAVLGPTPSTMDEARRMIDRFGGEPVLAITDRQTSGRGRHGRTWESADRALAASFAFRPAHLPAHPWPAPTWPRLSLVAGLAAAEVIAAAASSEPSQRPVRLKWPNDVHMDGAKVAGLLAEASGDVVVIGVGINLWWPSPVGTAAAVWADDPGPDAFADLAAAWADAMFARLGRGPDRWGHADYVERCTTVGTQIVWEPAGRGRAIGIHADGGLLVETADGRQIITSGEVRHVRPATG